MSLWSNSDANTSAPKYKAFATSNVSCQTAYQNVTPSAFVANLAAGVFAVDANGAGNTGGQVTYPGWVLVRQYTGPVTSLAVANDGASYANLAVGYLSNGSSNAYFYVTVNSTGHVQSATLVNAGAGFINSASVAIGRDASNGVASFNIGGGSGYANGELVRVSNGVINAAAVITTNTTGGISSLAFTAPTYAGAGFSANTASVVTITTANGTNGNVTVNALGAGAGLRLTATLGGRAGRTTYETLVAAGSIAVTANSLLFKA